MDDYHAIVSRAVHALGARDAAARRRVYDQARALLESRLRAGDEPATDAEIARHRAALAAAIDRIERGIAPGAAVGPPADAGNGEGLVAPRPAWRRAVAVGFAVIAAGAVAIAYVLWTAATRPSLSDREAVAAASSQSKDLAPGTDGGSGDIGLPFYLRRQTVFYRTTHPQGTLVVHKFQHYLYLVTGVTVARRYGIGVGEGCLDLAGLRLVKEKSEWPAWRPDQDSERKLAAIGPMPGGPGNPLGARAFELDDGRSRIHGTNAPGTIGHTLERGCIRMVNDDVVDLYQRVPIGTRVVITN